MKQKVVIKLSVRDERSRAKAMKTAVGVDGVNSASLQPEKEQIEVTGEDVDVVLLTTLLRKSVKYAEVVSVNPVEEKKKETEAIIQYAMGSPHYIWTTPYTPYQEPSCSIM